MKLSKSALIGTAAAGLLWSGLTLAGTASCPDPAVPGSRVFTVTTVSTTVSCLASGIGNDPGAFASFVFLDKFEIPDDNGGAVDDALSDPGIGLFGGNFSFNLVGYKDFVVVFKSGTAELDPDWAAFKIGNTNSGTWSIVPRTGQSLSHMSLYGVKCADGDKSCDFSSEVPLPAAA